MSSTRNDQPKEINGINPISITYYTDPLCCWSWAMEPVIRQLNEQFQTVIHWRYCMGGLLPGWGLYSDPVNSVSRPLQMGPVWMHAAQVGGVSIDHNIWFRDPPSSSYLACIAFKSVQLQAEEYASAYLLMMRERCMVDGINISALPALQAIAADLKKQFPGFDTDRFNNDMVNGRGREAFRADMQETTTAGIKRFPTMIIRQAGKPSLILTGYRPYEDLSGILVSHFDLVTVDTKQTIKHGSYEQ